MEIIAFETVQHWYMIYVERWCNGPFPKFHENLPFKKFCLYTERNQAQIPSLHNVLRLLRNLLQTTQIPGLYLDRVTLLHKCSLHYTDTVFILRKSSEISIKLS